MVDNSGMCKWEQMKWSLLCLWYWFVKLCLPLMGGKGMNFIPSLGYQTPTSPTWISFCPRLLLIFFVFFSDHGLLLDMGNNFVGCQIVYLLTKHLFFEQTSCHNSEVQDEEGLGRSRTIFLGAQNRSRAPVQWTTSDSTQPTKLTLVQLKHLITADVQEILWEASPTGALWTDAVCFDTPSVTLK